MKITLREWAQAEYSDGARPSLATLRKMAAAGDVPGAVQSTAGRWLVEVESNEADVEAIMRKAVGDDPEMLRAMGL